MLKTFCHLHDEEGIFRFYVGGALGVDMWAAEQLLYLKEQPGYQDIELIVALPFEGHDSKWDAMSKQRLQIIIHKEFHPLAKWEEFIADPGKYLNGMIEGEFEE